MRIVKRNIIFFILLTIVSCSKKNEKTMYRIVGKDGNVIYIDTRNQSENFDKTRKSFKNQKEDFANNSLKAEKIKNKTPKEQIKEQKIPKISSAYTLESVMDKNIKYNMNNNDSFEDITKNSDIKRKSINDFDNIPQSYFKDSEQNFKTVNSTNKENKKIHITKIKSNNETTSDQNSKTSYRIQLGLFSNKEKAIKVREKFKNYNVGIVEVKNSKNGKLFYKVITRPITKTEAKKISKEIKNEGYKDVFIFKE